MKCGRKITKDVKRLNLKKPNNTLGLLLYLDNQKYNKNISNLELTIIEKFIGVR